jgi:hypothetical protein
VGLFALKPIRKDTELTIDYSASHVGERGLENHCESRGGGSKAHREIPFKQFADEVRDLLLCACRKIAEGGGGGAERERDTHTGTRRHTRGLANFIIFFFGR